MSYPAALHVPKLVLLPFVHMKGFSISCVLFQNLDRYERNAPRSQSNLICSNTSEKIWLSHAHLCCWASALPVYLWNRAWFVALCAEENQMTTPTTTKKICVFFFSGLDQSRLTNLDRSRFVRFWKRMQPLFSSTREISRRSGLGNIRVTVQQRCLGLFSHVVQLLPVVLESVSFSQTDLPLCLIGSIHGTDCPRPGWKINVSVSFRSEFI